MISAVFMKTVIIHGQSHKGSTYHIAHTLGEKIGGECREFFLPRDFGKFCVGCNRCFMEGEEKCPHYEELLPITRAIDEADVIILASPVYVFHVTGAMKAFLDHYGHRWMVHCPEESMFHKQGVCICTAAGAGLKSTNKDMADSLFFWGVGKIYRYGKAVAAVEWKDVNEKKRISIEKATTSRANKIVRRHGKIKPAIKTRLFFYAMHFFQRKGLSERDAKYWKEKGWTGNKRPW